MQRDQEIGRMSNFLSPHLHVSPYLQGDGEIKKEKNI